MFSSRAIQVVSFGLVAALFTGCSNLVNEDLLRSAQVSFDDALAREASGDLAGALPLIDEALKKGGLNPDQLAEGYLLRARCYCASGELENAQADIDLADQGAPNPAKLHFTRGMLLDKQGKASEAKAEFDKAKRADPSVKYP